MSSYTVYCCDWCGIERRGDDPNFDAEKHMPKPITAHEDICGGCRSILEREQARIFDEVRSKLIDPIATTHWKAAS